MDRTINKLLLFLTLCVELMAAYHWRLCTQFKFLDPFSLFDVSLKVDDFVHNDNGLPFWLIRVFHNKIDVAFFEIIKKYLLWWDPKLVFEIVSVIGLIGVILG